MKYSNLVYYISLILLITSCAGDTAPGTFSVTFQWDDPPPDDTSSLGVWGKVERDGLQLAESLVVAYTDGVELDFSDVPNGTGLVIAVEIKEAVQLSSRTIYFGMSEPFTLEAGKHVEVEVKLSLKHTPDIPLSEMMGGSQYFHFPDATGPEDCQDCYTNQRMLDIVFKAEHASHVVISNIDNFPEDHSMTLWLETLTQNTDGFYTIPAWDLDKGLSDTSDGIRTVYFKLVGSQDYYSKVESRELILDTHPPAKEEINSRIVKVVRLSPEDLYVNVTLAVIGADEMWIEACNSDSNCNGPLDTDSDGVNTCNDTELSDWLQWRGATPQSKDKCLSGVNEWVEYNTFGWLRLSTGITKLRVKYRDYAHNVSGWAVLGFNRVTVVDPMKFVQLSSGSFWMGSPEGCPAPSGYPGECTAEPWRDTDEELHKVTLTHDFEMGQYEVTQDEFEAMMAWNSSSFANCGGNCPVENVSWFEAIAFANKMSVSNGFDECFHISNVVCVDTTEADISYMTCMNEIQRGIESADVILNNVSSVYDCEGYRLPTEAEWEYAIRAGTTTAFYNGIISGEKDSNMDAIGWYYFNNTPYGTKPVGGKEANIWGLFDMSGNVWEWTWDWYQAAYWTDYGTDPAGMKTGSYRLLRGGSWPSYASGCRSANRSTFYPDYRNLNVGFRLSRSRP